MGVNRRPAAVRPARAEDGPAPSGKPFPDSDTRRVSRASRPPWAAAGPAAAGSLGRGLPYGNSKMLPGPGCGFAGWRGAQCRSACAEEVVEDEARAVGDWLVGEHGFAYSEDRGGAGEPEMPRATRRRHAAPRGRGRAGRPGRGPGLRGNLPARRAAAGEGRVRPLRPVPLRGPRRGAGTRRLCPGWSGGRRRRASSRPRR